MADISEPAGSQAEKGFMELGTRKSKLARQVWARRNQPSDEGDEDQGGQIAREGCRPRTVGEVNAVRLTLPAPPTSLEASRAESEEPGLAGAVD